jgi:hypothetical protein
MATPDQLNQPTRDMVTPCLRAAEEVVMAFRRTQRNAPKLRTMRTLQPGLTTTLEELSNIWGECDDVS